MSISQPSFSFQIRRAEPDDVEALVRLRLEFLEEVNRKPTPDGLQQSLETYFQTALLAGDFIAWLAIAEGQIVGTSGLVFMHRPPSHSNLSGRDAYIMNMYTLPSWRGRGVGTALFQQVLTYIQSTDSGKAFLHATKSGRRLYEKFGFHTEIDEVEMIVDVAKLSPLYQ